MTAINEEFFTNLENKIDSINKCDELNEFINEKINKVLTEQLEKALLEVDKLTALLEIPNTPEKVITWIGKFITVLNGPVLKMIVAQTQLALKYVSLIEKVTAKIATLQCTITPPTLPNIPTPPTLPTP
jgi:dsDNA-specific endonuclease/ATPase MutS2